MLCDGRRAGEELMVDRLQANGAPPQRAARRAEGVSWCMVACKGGKFCKGGKCGPWHVVCGVDLRICGSVDLRRGSAWNCAASQRAAPEPLFLWCPWLSVSCLLLQFFCALGVRFLAAALPCSSLSFVACPKGLGESLRPRLATSVFAYATRRLPCSCMQSHACACMHACCEMMADVQVFSH